MSTFLTLCGGVLAALLLPGTLYLALVTLAGCLPPRRICAADTGTEAAAPLAFVVPAHNEAADIERTVSNLLDECRRDGHARVVVVADNCDDDTAARARRAGADVLERTHRHLRGKGHALDFAFKALMHDKLAGVVVVDADSSVKPGFLASIRRHFSAGDDAVQARYGVRNGKATPRTQLAEIALAAFNVLRPRGRSRLGVSCGLLGNGFALTRETLMKVPYRAGSVVEDLEYHLMLLEAGLKVGFADGAQVVGDMPVGQRGQTNQRARWEGGRLRMLLTQAGPLLRQLLRGRWVSLEPLLELMLPPLGHHLMLSFGAGALMALGGQWPGAALVVGLVVAVIFAHVIAAIAVVGLPWSRLWMLARIPAYLIWKLSVLRPTLSQAQRNAEWVRTARDGS